MQSSGPFLFKGAVGGGGGGGGSCSAVNICSAIYCILDLLLLPNHCLGVPRQSCKCAVIRFFGCDGCVPVQAVFSMSLFYCVGCCCGVVCLPVRVGAVELVDCSNDLPDLKREPGLSSWHVSITSITMSYIRDGHLERGTCCNQGVWFLVCGVNTYSFPYTVSIVFFRPIFILCKLSCTASW